MRDIRRWIALIEAPYDPRAQYTFQPPVRNRAFRRWFGNSKVIDHAGHPMIVWHGIKNPDVKIIGKQVVFIPPFETFELRDRVEPGIWFSPDPTVAAHYGTPVPFYLKMTRPIREESPLTAIPPNCDGVYRTRSSHDSIADAWELAVFHPNQIKAVFNAGTFAANDPRFGH